jgi:hypothetical protein
MMISFFIFRRPIIAVEGEIWRWSFDPSGFPDLWMEVGSSDGPDKNRVYRLSNTTTRTCGRPVVSQLLGAPNQYRGVRGLAATHGSAHRKIRAPIGNLWTTQAHLTEKYKQLSANYEQLRQIVMNMASQSGDTCAPPFWPYNN